jgi:hypothetical protein
MLPRPANENRHRFLQTPYERRHRPLVVLAFLLAMLAGALLAWTLG